MACDMNFLFFVWIVAVLGFKKEEVEEIMAKPWEEDYRLPREVHPLHYDLYLNPNLETDRFSGSVTIHLKINTSMNYLLAHIKYMNVTRSEVRDQNGLNLTLSNAFEYPENEFWVVQMAQTLSPGNYTLRLEFDGLLDNGIVGFYKSVYLDENQRQHSIATSKFQPTYARRAFPCFDEPTFKSTFTITVVTPSGNNYMALSNMVVESSQPDRPSPSLTEVTFQKSVPMVTYLAVFIVSDFIYVVNGDGTTPGHRIPFKVYGTTVQSQHLQYALDIGANITDFYIDYFNVPYPLPKLDMAAIPDYSSGATEHWGMITYRETNLIYDPAQSSSSNQQRVASVIAHELVHQWFGNLVTLEWWNDLWLNEGFATFLSYKGVKSYEKDWDTNAWFLYGDLHPVLDLDATLSSHSIVVDVDTPDQINSVFDTISYSKGSSVIRMMEAFMGEKEFREGITNFLTKFSFKNAITQDLFDELTAVSTAGLDITRIMNTWTRQKGYPVLNLVKNGNNYVITQERFLTDPEAYSKETEPSEYDYKWEVPVTYISSMNMTKTQTWMHLEDDQITVPIPSGSTWVKFNVEQLGYYRVNYPTEDWQKLSMELNANFNTFSSSDRSSLLNDAFSLAAGDRVSYEVALDMTKYLGQEDQLAPWVTFNGQINYFSSVFYYTDAYSNLISYTKNLSNDAYTRLGWNDTDEQDFNERMLRPSILSLACSSENPNCLTTAGQKFLEWKQNGIPVAPNLRTVVYVYGMKTVGNQEIWDWMLQKYLEESNAQEKVKLMNGLASVKDPWILYNFIQMAKNTSIVREQDYFTLIGYISNNRAGEQVVWDFVRDEWEYLVERFTLNNRSFGRMMSDITSKFATERRLQEMRDFFELYPEAGAGEQYRSIALEQVESNIKFLQKHKDTINQWLTANI